MLENNKSITITRGDSLDYAIGIDVGHPMHRNKFLLDSDDKMYFGVYECGSKFEDSILMKVIDYTNPIDNHGDYIIHFNQWDTEKLKVGKYLYSVKVNVYNGHNKYDTITILNNKEFWVV